MRIAFLIGQFPNTSETFILNQITGLIDRGHEISILAEKPTNVQIQHPDVNKYALLNVCRYRNTPRDRIRRTLIGIGLVSRLIGKYPQALLGSLNVLKYRKEALSLHLLFAASSVLNERPYDVIVCHFGPLGILGSRLSEIGALKGKLVTFFHGRDLSAMIAEQGTNVYRELFGRGGLFLPVSLYWRSKLLELGCEASDSVVVHHMGVDLGQFRLTPRELKRNEVFRVVSVARLVEKKGIEYGIRAFAALSRKYENVKYTIIGDGPLRTKLEKMANELVPYDRIEFTGALRQDDVQFRLAESHILLAPSITATDGDQEGIPVAMMEALAMGLPIVTTDHSGIPELVRHGVCGRIVPEGDVDGLASNMELFVRNPALLTEYGKNGRAIIEKQFNIDIQNDKLESILIDLVQNIADCSV